MKDVAILLLTIVLAHSGFAQDNFTKTIEDFDKIKVFDRIEVSLVKSNENKVVLTGEDMDEAVVSLKNGLLKIRMEFDNQGAGGTVKATVYYKNELTLIDANENAKINSKETVSGSNVKIAAQEAGKITLKVDIDNLITKSSSGGIITLTGKAKKQEVIANAGGKVRNKALVTESTEVSANAGGDAEINGTDFVKATARAGGNIEVYGSPKTIDKNKVFGGKIKLID